jgi:putative ABC transport system ATP-binding protein
MNKRAVIARAVGLSKEFGGVAEARVRAVQDVTLKILAGEMTLITGPSGSGKTTLLSMLGGLIPPSAGELELAGCVATGLPQSKLTELRLRSVGFVFQSFQLIDALSVVENAELPLNLAGVGRPESQRRAMELLEELGLGDRLHFRPRSLSGGEKQRVAIARALANHPPLLLADEPTGSLDSRAGLQVIELLHAAARERGKAVLVVSHDLRIRSYADRVFTMEDGVLLPSEIRSPFGADDG